MEENYDLYPIDNEVICPRCGNKGAYFWSIQTRAGDEGENNMDPNRIIGVGILRIPLLGYIKLLI